MLEKLNLILFSDFVGARGGARVYREERGQPLAAAGGERAPEDARLRRTGQPDSQLGNFQAGFFSCFIEWGKNMFVSF